MEILTFYQKWYKISARHYLPLNQRVINAYEGNKLEVKGDDIYINDNKADSYTFKMDYYWMMGYNRHNSADSSS